MTREAKEGERGMPGRQEPKKDVVHCEKRRGVVCRRKSRRCPNGETRQVKHASHLERGEGTRGTETSEYPEEKKRFRE